ncbi:MAG: TorD/DmsD family molecular chaperone [Telluria sp.]
MHATSAGPSHSNAGTSCTALLPLSGEDQARADLYALLARLLLAAPDEALLADLAAADPICAEHDSALEAAWRKLTLAAGVTDVQAVADEFGALFISVGTPMLNPYESRYLSGFLNDGPLASLRADLAELGLARARGVGDFEDHLAGMCETMRVLIVGGPGILRQPVLRQKWFFERHLAPWHARCLADIANAEGSSFYRLVAGFALAFFTIEAEAFAFEESIDG